MVTISATEAKNKLGACLDKAQREPVLIESSGRPRAVILNYEEYERLQTMEDYYWVQRANEAEKSGYLGSAATAELIKETLTEDANIS
jgi:prevent-host-death family protein